MNGAVERPNRLRREPGALLRVPLATYRVQLGPSMTFDGAAALVPYLDALGITDLYASPFFETATDSAHGYDVSDHNRLREALGGEAGFTRLTDSLRRHAFGLLIDVVPNHMGIARARNAWWRDVLENGPSSAYAGFFDIEWRPVKTELADKVLLPILGDQYGAVLDGGQLRLEFDDGVLSLVYYETRLPIAPRTWGRILGHRITELQAVLGSENPDLLELKSIVTWFASIPAHTDTDPPSLAARQRDREAGRQRLAKLCANSRAVRDFIEENVRLFNGKPGDPASFDCLDGLLSDQAYRLAYWRAAGDEINYRRFFDIDELAAIRMEDPAVFAETHRLVGRLVREGVVTGLRVDHPDGLYAPAAYLRRLQQECVLATGRPLYIVVEKILSPSERLPDTWSAAGTTGYEFLNTVNGIFVDRSQARTVDQVYERLLRDRVPFAEIVYHCKRMVMETSMASELNTLGHRLNVISEKHRSSRDFTLRSLTQALGQIIACFPVYRTYFGDRGDVAADREHLARAVEAAKRRSPAVDPSTYDWIQSLLVLEVPPWAQEHDRRERADFVMRFQQITGPVAAKGYEDGALYRYNRLTSLNEVGGDPSRFGTSMAEFHGAMKERYQTCPAALSASSTHDTKRSEDVRARINVLSEIPHEWRARVARWHRLNRRHGSVVDGRPVPGPNEEYLIYQTLVGAWPIGPERLTAYVLKAAREAKAWTSWINPNARYEAALTRFADTIVDPRRSRQFLRDLGLFHARVAHFGALASLGQTLIKITAPGVPDFYQGTELWDFSLVDPDNRRPVDFEFRRRLLDELIRETEATPDLATLARHLVETKRDGRVKMFLIRQALGFRRRHAALFLGGGYLPIESSGSFADHVCAFGRAGANLAALVVVPRLLARRGIEDLPFGESYWETTRLVLPPGLGVRFRDVFTGNMVDAEPEPTGAAISVGRALADFPVALLERVA